MTFKSFDNITEELKATTGKEVFRCSLCGEYFYGYGNNPYPVMSADDDRCCDMCNSLYVIPARLKAMRHSN